MLLRDEDRQAPVAEVMARAGWELKPEGACRGDICIPLGAAQTLEEDREQDHDRQRPQQPERFKHQLTSVLSNKQHFNHYVVKCHSPQTQAERTLQIVSRPLYHQKKFLFAIEDITKQHLAQKQQRLAANVFDSSQDAIIVLSQSGIIEMVNPAFLRMFELQNIFTPVNDHAKFS